MRVCVFARDYVLLCAGLSVPICIYVRARLCLWNCMHTAHAHVFYTNNIFEYALGVRHNGVQTACVRSR